MRLEPIISGGGQERGLRSGTLPSTLAVGMGAACDLAKKEMSVSTAILRSLPADTYAAVTKIARTNIFG